MKKIKIFPFLLFSFVAVALVTSCSKDPDLPYPIDEVTQGALIDVYKIDGTAGYVETNIAANNNVGVRLQMVQKGAGDFQKIQLICVYNNTRSVVVKDDITQLPVDITINFPAVVTQFGLSSINGGDDFTFTANVVRKDGSVVYGWRPETKVYNNTNFAQWMVGSRTYSSKASYATQCSFVPTAFQGTLTCDEKYSGGSDSYTVTSTPISDLPSPMPAGVTAADLYGLEIDGLSPNITDPATPIKLKVWINKKDYSLIIPNYALNEDWGDGPVFLYNVKDAKCLTCTNQLVFTMSLGMPGLGNYITSLTFTIHP